MSRLFATGSTSFAAVMLFGGCTSDSAAPTPATTQVRATPPTSATAPVPSTPARPPRVRGARVLAWHLPTPLSRSVAMTVGPRVLLAGGLEAGDHSTDRVLTLDLRRGVVGEGRLALPVHDSAGAVLSGRPTIIGGGGATELADVQRRGRRGRWQVTGRLPAARSDLTVLTAAGGGFVIGGYDGTSTPRSILRTDGHRFRPAGTLPLGLRYAGGCKVGGALWILGGEVDGRELDEVLRFDPLTGRVRTMGTLPQPLGHEAVIAVGTRLLVIGGRTSPSAVTGQMWWYDTKSRRWTRAGELPHPVADAPSISHGSSVYLFGGETPDFSADVVRVRWRHGRG